MDSALPFEPFDPRRLDAPFGEQFRRSRRVDALLGESNLGDPERRAEVSRELLLLGTGALPHLRAASQKLPEPNAGLAREIVKLLVPDETGTELYDCLNEGLLQFPAERAAALLARLAYPDLTVESVLTQIEALAQSARTALPDPLRAALESKPDEDQTVKALLAIGEFWRTQGFKGDAENFYDPKNSWLPDVLERRRGLPIAMAVLYVALCKRLGLRAEGVGLPYHFIARVEVPTRDGTGYLYVDPFNGARPLDLDDCKRLVEAGGQTFEPAEHLKPATTRDILVRMCNNLLGTYDQLKRTLEAEHVATVLKHLSPDSPIPILLRAERRLKRGAHREARADLQAALAMDQEGPAGRAAESLLRQLDYEFPG